MTADAVALGLGLPVLALVSAALVRAMAARGVLDVPGARSSHDRPTPKGGGVGIVAAVVLGLLLAVAFGVVPAGRGVPVVVATLLLAAVAWADDVRQFGFAPKLAAQAAAALLLALAGDAPAEIGPWHTGLLAIPIAVVVMVFVANAFNFIDGLNGLASGSGLIVAVACGEAAARTGDTSIAAVAWPLAAGLAGFLPFNYPRARIFMGDVGSQPCGLLLGALACGGGGLRPGGWGSAVAVLGLFAIGADVAFTLVRRAISGARLTEAHRGHLYQLAHRAGIPAPSIALVYWGLAALGVLVATLLVPRDGIAAIGSTVAGVAAWACYALWRARRAPIGAW